MMSLFAVAGILCCLGTIYLPGEISVWTLVGISGCMSLMFPTIYGIALRSWGLKETGSCGPYHGHSGRRSHYPVHGFLDRQHHSKNQLAYFESINRPLIRAGGSCGRSEILIWSHAGAVQDVKPALRTEKNKLGPPAKFQKNLETFFTLPSLEGDAFEQAAKSLPGCSSLKPRELAVFKANLERLPAPAGREQQIQQFSLIPALSTLSGNQAEVLDNLIALPLDMKQFQTAQKLRGKSGAVILLYSHHLLCRGINLRLLLPQHSSEKEEEEKPYPGMNQLHITYARYENSITNHRYPPHD